MKPLKEVKKNASPENSITKKMSTGSSLYYDGFVSYDFTNIQFCLIQIKIGAILRHPDRGILRSSPHLIEPHAARSASTS